METLKTSSDTLFILLGAIMVLAMHAGFAFLELGTVRKKNQVNALVKIVVDFAVSTIAYFFVGYSIAYGVNFFAGAETLALKSGYELVKFFFLLTFAAAIPAIVSGGIAERARFNPQLAATFLLVGFVYPFFEGIAWNQHYGVQAWLKGALATGVVAGGLFVFLFTQTQNRWKIDDVLGVWPLHGVCGAWGGIAAGIFGSKVLGGLGGVAFASQLAGTLLGIGVAVAGATIVYGVLKKAAGLRLDPEEEWNGADLTIHRISATAERETSG